MKKLVTTLLLVVLALAIHAQDNQTPRFSPEKFEAELQGFIAKEAHLTPQEATKFFAVYKEMQEKQRALFDKQRELAKTKPSDEQGCLKVIKESDAIDLELKQIQQTYHAKFIKLLSASKVYDILQAEQRFHRRMMKSWGRGGGNWQGQKPQWGQGQKVGPHWGQGQMPQWPQAPNTQR